MVMLFVDLIITLPRISCMTLLWCQYAIVVWVCWISLRFPYKNKKNPNLFYSWGYTVLSMLLQLTDSFRTKKLFQSNYILIWMKDRSHHSISVFSSVLITRHNVFLEPLMNCSDWMNRFTIMFLQFCFLSKMPFVN